MIEPIIRAFIAENYIFDSLPPGGGDSLTQMGILDSMGVLELIMFIEERFGFKIPDEDTLPENLDTIDNIVRYIERRREAVKAA
jgi:acyl carrier protein